MVSFLVCSDFSESTLHLLRIFQLSGLTQISGLQFFLICFHLYIPNFENQLTGSQQNSDTRKSLLVVFSHTIRSFRTHCNKLISI